MIRAVIFDFGGVLVRTGTPAGRRKWETRLHLTPGDLERLVHGSDVWIAAQRGELSPEMYWLEIAQRLGISPAEIPALRADYFRDDQLDPALITLIRELRAQGYPVGLLSNDAATLEAKLRDELHIYDAFDAVVISANIGVMKPDAGAYQAIAAALHLSTPECLFIDDNAANVDGARAAGMFAVQYVPGMDVRAALTGVLEKHQTQTRALIFDFGNVLDTPLDWDAVWAMRDVLAAPFGRTGRDLHQFIYISEPWERVKVGKISYEEYLDGVFRPLGVVDPAAQRKLMEDYHGGREKINPTMLALLHELRPHYKLAVLSNAWQRTMEAWLLDIEPRLKGIFDEVVSSAAVGIAKPDPAVYRLTLERLHVAPNDALFIDDLSRNTVSAEATGLPSIVFESPEQLRKALTLRHIL